MGSAVILNFLKAILPTKKIGAWILGLLGAVVALALGISNGDLKATFCATDAASMPAIKLVPEVPVAPAPVAVPVQIVSPAPKK